VALSFYPISWVPYWLRYLLDVEGFKALLGKGHKCFVDEAVVFLLADSYWIGQSLE